MFSPSEVEILNTIFFYVFHLYLESFQCLLGAYNFNLLLSIHVPAVFRAWGGWNNDRHRYVTPTQGHNLFFYKGKGRKPQDG